MKFRISLVRRGLAFALAAAVACGTAFSVSANEGLLALQAVPGQVPMPNMSYNAQNFSNLSQINVQNVQWLQPAWVLPLQVVDLYESSPLVIGDTMYIITPKPNYVYALDLNNNGAIKWEYRPDIPAETFQAATSRHCCFAITRGLNYADGKILFTTLTGDSFAIDAQTGEHIWGPVSTADIFGINETNSGNGIVVHDLFIIGNVGGENGVRGKVTALDINTGTIRWQFYNMGPNNEVGIGPRFNPFYADDKVPNPALDSWYGDSYLRGGGTAWGFFSFDPQLNLVYYSTGNCAPWSPEYRREFGVVDLDEKGGLISFRNNYCASLMARDATTGELIWAYNITPQEGYDIDEPGQNILADLVIDGEVRKTLIKAARNGFFYVFDRATGELLLEPWPHSYVTFAKGVDMETGRLLYEAHSIMFQNLEDRAKYTDANYGTGGTGVAFCPGGAARNWYNDSYSPQTGLVYTVVTSDCAFQRLQAVNYTGSTGYNGTTAGGGTNPLSATGGTSRNPDGTTNNWTNPDGTQVNGWVHAIEANDPINGKLVWMVASNPANQAAVMSTAGGLVFQAGRNDGTLKAYDAATGVPLWTFFTGLDGSSSPISFMGTDGRQYIAYIGSRGGAQGAVTNNAAANSAARYARQGAAVYVFALPHPIAGTTPNLAMGN